MTCLSWVALYGMAHSFIELHKPLSHNKAVIHEGDRGAWHAVIHVFAKSWTQLNDWTTVFPMWIVTYHVCLLAGPSAPAFSSLSTVHTFTPCFLCLCASLHALLLLGGWSFHWSLDIWVGRAGSYICLFLISYAWMNFCGPVPSFLSILFHIDLYPFSLFSLTPYTYTVLSSWRHTGSSKIYVKSLFLFIRYNFLFFSYV